MPNNVVSIIFRMILRFTVLLTILEVVNSSGDLPQIKEHPKSITARKNDPATFNCAASEGSRFRWYRNGHLLPDKGRAHRYIILDNGSLFFLRVADGKKENDSGVYRCEAFNEFGSTRSRNATLTIATLGNDFLDSPEPTVQGHGGGPLTLTCRPPEGTPPPIVKWKHNNQFVSNSSRLYILPNGDLVFEEVLEKDVGIYICVAQNVAATKEADPVSLSVIFSPWFEEKPQNMTVIAGSAIEFNCKVKGSPHPKVSWRRIDGKMPLGRTQVTGGRTLRMEDISASDSGTYACDAKNEAGSATAFGTLTVVAAPVLKEKPNNKLALTGIDLTLNCLVKGDPSPLTIWRLPFQDHSSHLLAGQEKGRISVSDDSSILKISNSQLEDTGLYQCWGVSSGGGVSSSAKVVVVEALPPPLIGVRPKDKFVSPRSSVMFPCEVVSEKSEPTITWWFQRAAHLPSRKIVPKGSSSILPTGMLILKEVDDGDAGIYRCRVTSDAGTVEAEAILKIDEKANRYEGRHYNVPAPPSKPKITAFNSSSVQLSWLPNSRDPSGKSVTYTIEYWRSPWQEWRRAATEVRDETYLITDLLSKAAYTFLVRAVDVNGESFPSPWSDVIYATDSDDPGLTLEGEKQARRRLNKPSVSLISVRTITADTVLLSWKILQGSEMELDGVIIYTIGEDDIRTGTVLGEASSSYVRDLRSNSLYTFFLVPLWRTIQGVPSNSKQINTPEEVPRVSPRGLNAEIYNSGTVLLRWNPLTSFEARGNVVGYQLSFSQNGSTTVQSTSNSWYEAEGLASGRIYAIKVAAVTGAGVGPWSPPEPIKIPEPPKHGQQEGNVSEKDEVPSVLYPPPHPGWLMYLLVPVIVLLIVCVLLYLRRLKRKSSASSLEPTSGPTLYADPTIYTPHHQRVNMYGDQKLWRPTDSDKDSSLSSTRLLRPEHLVNEYAEPRIQRLNDTAEPYATTALLAPSTPRIGRTPPSWRHGRCAADENGIQVNWAAFLPPPPSCPPPPNMPPLEGESFSSATTSSDSGDRRCYSPPSQYENAGGSEQYEHPCDATSEHTYAVYSPTGSEAQGDSFPTFCTLQGRPLRRVRVDFHPARPSEPPKSNTH